MIQACNPFSSAPAWMPSREEIKEEALKVENIPMIIKVADVFRNAMSAAKELCLITRERYLLGGLRLIAIVNIPFVIHHIGTLILNVKTSINEKIDIAINIITECGCIADIVATFTEGLGSVGAIAAEIVWLTPLSIACMAVELLGLALIIKNFVETHLFIQFFENQTNLQTTEDSYTMEDFRRGLDAIEERQLEESSFIGKHFNVDDERFVERLVTIEYKAREKLASDNPDEVAEGQKSLCHAMHLLKNRLKEQQWSKALTALTVVISTVAFFILFLTTITPLGYAFLGVTGAICLTHCITNWIRRRQFEHSLEAL